MNDDDEIYKNRAGRNDHAEHREQLQRNEREARDQIEVEPDQLVERVLRLAGRALGVFDLDLARAVGVGVSERRDKCADLARGGDGADDVAAVRAQHAALVGHLDAGNALAHAIHRLRGHVPPPRVLARAAYAADVIVPGIHGGDEFADLLRRILEVGIESDDTLAAAMLETGDDCEVLSIVGIEHDYPRHVGALQELILEHRRRPVAAAIVDEDDFVAPAELVERRIETVEERLQSRLLVVNGDHDRQRRRRRDHVRHLRPAAITSATEAQTRSTSVSAMPACKGSVTVSREMRSAFGYWPSCPP